MSQRPTPETDALMQMPRDGLKFSVASLKVCASTLRDHARRLERQRDELREALLYAKEQMLKAPQSWGYRQAGIPQIDEALASCESKKESV